MIETCIEHPIGPRKLAKDHRVAIVCSISPSASKARENEKLNDTLSRLASTYNPILINNKNNITKLYQENPFIAFRLAITRMKIVTNILQATVLL